MYRYIKCNLKCQLTSILILATEMSIIMNIQKPIYHNFDANCKIKAFEGTPTEANRPVDADKSTETKKAEAKELLLGKDNRPSYTAEQLRKIGFNDNNACYGIYFEASSDNLLDMRAGNVTYKLKSGLKANGKEIKTVYELLKVLNNGIKIEVPDSRSVLDTKINTDFYRK